MFETYQFVSIHRSDGRAKINTVKELTTTEFADFKRACVALSEHEASIALFPVAQRNFEIIEEWLLEIVRTHPVPSSDSLRDEIRRLLVNTISSVRTAWDHSDWKASNDFGEEALAEIREAKNLEYDGSFSYRFCEAPRNHAIHKGLPSLRIRVSSGRPSEIVSQRFTGDDRDVSVAVYIKRDTLLADSKLKAAIAHEIGDGPEEIELTGPLREQLAALDRVSALFRWLSAASVADQAQLVLDEVNHALLNGFAEPFMLFEPRESLGTSSDEYRTSYVKVSVASARSVLEAAS